MSEQAPELNKETILSEQDKQLIRIIRKMKSGELHIIVANGTPKRAEEITKNINL